VAIGPRTSHTRNSYFFSSYATLRSSYASGRRVHAVSHAVTPHTPGWTETASSTTTPTCSCLMLHACMYVGQRVFADHAQMCVRVSVRVCVYKSVWCTPACPPCTASRPCRGARSTLRECGRYSHPDACRGPWLRCARAAPTAQPANPRAPCRHTHRGRKM
jgi:hypothetical protein